MSHGGSCPLIATEMNNPKTQYSKSKAGQELGKKKNPSMGVFVLPRTARERFRVLVGRQQSKRDRLNMSIGISELLGPGPLVAGFWASPSVLSSPSMSSLRVNPGPPHL